MSTEVRNLVIIGSGPAGYTAAIYAARANLKPVIFEGSVTAGGALMTTTEVENYPGFSDAIMGPDLMDAMRAQAERFGAELVRDDVTEVSLDGPVKTVTDGEGNTWSARTVILAMGSAYRQMGLPDESRLAGHGVSWCATCDGFFFRDQDIAVVGGGYNPKISFAWNSAVDAIHGVDKVTGVTLRDTLTGQTRLLPVTGVFVAIGHDPRNELVKGVVDLDAGGYVQVQGRTTATNVAGVFASGDLVDHTYRQAVTAAGSGCAAALDAEHYLADLDDAAERAGGGAAELSDRTIDVG